MSPPAWDHGEGRLKRAHQRLSNKIHVTSSSALSFLASPSVICFSFGFSLGVAIFHLPLLSMAVQRFFVLSRHPIVSFFAHLNILTLLLRLDRIQLHEGSRWEFLSDTSMLQSCTVAHAMCSLNESDLHPSSLWRSHWLNVMC